MHEMFDGINRFCNLVRLNLKTMAIHKHENGDYLAMNFEELATSVFKAGRSLNTQDPWGYAEANNYNEFTREPLSNKAKEMFFTIIDVAIYDNSGNEDLVGALIVLKNEVWSMESQVQAIDMINRLIDLLNQHGY